MYMIHTVHMQLFQLKFKVFPELSGKVEYEPERLNNTVLKCGRPIDKVIFSTLQSYILLQNCQPGVGLGQGAYIYQSRKSRNAQLEFVFV